MQKKIWILAVSSLIACGNVFASTNLGSGYFGSGNGNTPDPTSVTLSLNSLVQGARYNIYCQISSYNAYYHPVIARFDLQNNMSDNPINVLFDDKPLFSKQTKLSDVKLHILEFPNVDIFRDSTLNFTWLAGDGVIDQVRYECFADPVVGASK